MSRITIIDVAKKVGVSTATVSNYLNEHYEKMAPNTKESIRKAIEMLGYIPSAQAQALTGKSTGIIAVLILDNTNAWAAQLTRGIEDATLAAGYHTVICNSRFNPQTESAWVEKMLSIGVDGLLIQPTNQFRALDRRITKVKRPVVYYDCDLFDFNTSWIKSNLYDGVYSATSQCIEKGYESFIAIGGEPTGRTRTERESGFADALSSAGFTYERLTVDSSHLQRSQIAAWLKGHLYPAQRTLIYVPNQWALRDVYLTIIEQGYVIPERVGLLGFNNTDWTDLTQYPISTIIEPVYEEGHLACEMLLHKLKDPETPPVQKVLPCTVRWLSSTV